MSENKSDLFRESFPAAAGCAAIIVIALLVVCVPVGAQTAKDAQPNSPTGSIKNGKQLYASQGCFGCHGRTGEGSKLGGPRIGPPPIPLEQFKEYVRKPAGKMPPFSNEILSDEELKDIYIFLKSIPLPPPAKSVPDSPPATKSAQPESTSGNLQNGKQLYTSAGCYECHGSEGQGSRFSGARLGPPSMSLGGFTEYIRQPVGQMPPYTSKVLADAELGDIYAFLKSIPQPPPAKSIPLLN